MPTKQDDPSKGTANTENSVRANEFGLSFRGLITSVDQVKEWKKFGTSEVLGLQCALGLSDKNRIYTYSLKAPLGETMPELQFMQEITLINAGCMSDKGQHRLTGDLVL